MTKKKIISVVCAISMSLSGIVYADKFNDTVDTEYEYAVDVMTSFGAMKGEEGYFFAASELSRAEFAQIIYDISDLGNTKEQGENTQVDFWGNIASDSSSTVGSSFYFTDVPDYNPSYDAINYVAMMGYMGGVGEDRFEPDRSIKLEEALKSLLCFLSLEVPENAAKNYPDNVLSKAASLGLLKGVKAARGENLKKGELAQILYNSLEAEVLNFSSNASGKFFYYYDGSTVMSAIMKVNCVRGTVSMNDVTSLTGESTLSKNQIMLNNVVLDFDDAHAGIRDMIGRSVKVYYRENDDANQVLYYEIEKRDNVIVINSDDIMSYNNGVLEYEYNNRYKTVEIPNGTPVIYNGHAIQTYDENTLNFQSGSVTIIKTESSCDAVIIEDYASMYVSEINVKEKTIFNTLISNRTQSEWQLEDDDKVIIYNADGEIISLENILPGNTLSIINNNGYVKIYVSDKIVSGTVAGFSTVENAVKVGSEAYEISNEYLNSYGYAQPQNNDEVTMYIDYFGKVVYIEYQNEEIRDCGYLVRAYMDDDSKVFYKMYLPNGSFVDYEAFDTVYFVDVNDNRTKLKYEERRDRFAGQNMFVYYKLNADEKIKEIAMPVTEMGQKEKGRLIANIATNESENYPFKTNAMTFAGRVFVDNSTKVMVIPTDINDFSKYSIANQSIWQNNGKYAIEAYTNDPYSKCAQVVIYHYQSNTAIDSGTFASYVVSIERTIDEDDNVVDEAVLNYNGTEKTVRSYVDDSGNSGFNNVGNPSGVGSYNIQAGDIVVAQADKDNELLNIAIVYSKGAKNPRTGSYGFLAGVYSDRYHLASSYVDETTGRNDVSKLLSSNRDAEVNNCNPYAVEITGNRTFNQCGGAHSFRMWGFRFMVGYVLDFDGTYITYTTQDLSKDKDYIQNGIPTDVAEQQLSEINSSLANNTYTYKSVYITETHKYANTEYKYKVDYTGKTPVLSKLETSDIKSFRKYGNACSKVLLKTRDGYPQQLFVLVD